MIGVFRNLFLLCIHRKFPSIFHVRALNNTILYRIMTKLFMFHEKEECV